jgi:hypothetical protein
VRLAILCEFIGQVQHEETNTVSIFFFLNELRKKSLTFVGYDILNPQHLRG